jgi:hypothetical protein
LAVDPNDPNTIYVGDTELYKFSGGAWTDVAGYDHPNIVHVDMHALEFAPGAAPPFISATTAAFTRPPTAPRLTQAGST